MFSSTLPFAASRRLASALIPSGDPLGPQACTPASKSGAAKPRPSACPPCPMVTHGADNLGSVSMVSVCRGSVANKEPDIKTYHRVCRYHFISRRCFIQSVRPIIQVPKVLKVGFGVEPQCGMTAAGFVCHLLEQQFTRPQFHEPTSRWLSRAG